VLTRIEIEGLRGIGHGVLEGLAPVTVLTGANGSGKSTVLDAVALVAADDPAPSLVRAIQRRGARNGARWILPQVADPNDWRAGPLARVTGVMDGEPRGIRGATLWLGAGGARVIIRAHRAGAEQGGAFRLGPDNVPLDPVGSGSAPLIDPSEPADLVALWSAALAAGAKRSLLDLLPIVHADAVDVDVLQEADGSTALYLDLGRRSIPLRAAGDGVEAALRIAMELAPVASGVVLLEEPEVFQHPRLLRTTARLLHAAAQRGIQVILTTHSQELIAALVEEDPSGQAASVGVFVLRLDQATLWSARHVGDDLVRAREMDFDLR
jgi:energy-coupling factor transporter ATP-binding protein EcfA2